LSQFGSAYDSRRVRGVAGNPAFLGFGGITWVALVGHVIFAVVAATVFRLRGAANPQVMPATGP